MFFVGHGSSKGQGAGRKKPTEITTPSICFAQAIPSSEQLFEAVLLANAVQVHFLLSPWVNIYAVLYSYRLIDVKPHMS